MGLNGVLFGEAAVTLSLESNWTLSPVLFLRFYPLRCLQRLIMRRSGLRSYLSINRFSLIVVGCVMWLFCKLPLSGRFSVALVEELFLIACFLLQFRYRDFT